MSLFTRAAQRIVRNTSRVAHAAARDMRTGVRAASEHVERYMPQEQIQKFLSAAEKIEKGLFRLHPDAGVVLRIGSGVGVGAAYGNQLDKQYLCLDKPDESGIAPLMGMMGGVCAGSFPLAGLVAPIMLAAGYFSATTRKADAPLKEQGPSQVLEVASSLIKQGDGVIKGRAC